MDRHRGTSLRRIRTSFFMAAEALPRPCTLAALLFGASALGGCGEGRRDVDPFGGSGLGSAADEDGTDDGASEDSGDAVSDFDVGSGATDGPGQGEQVCHVVDAQDGVAPCIDRAPADSFEPEVQWAWNGDGERRHVVTTPLVANLTDDDGDGTVDLCDVPDVVVVVYEADDFSSSGNSNFGRIAVLDGATGSVHAVFETTVAAVLTPALADIDGDGGVEIVTVELDDSAPFAETTLGRLVVFEPDGTRSVTGDWIFGGFDVTLGAVAIADLDADGDAEIMIEGSVFDHEGRELWSAYDRGGGLPVAADLDADGDLEVVLGGAAHHHDGSTYFDVLGDEHGMSVVADIDGDGRPEVIVVMWPSGITIIEHDGTVTVSQAMPSHAARRPAAIHDVDGDEQVEILVASDESAFNVISSSLALRWSAAVDDGSGMSGSTAFDFLGDGSAEAMYTDERQLYVFGDGGDVLLTSPRTSWTSIEYPVVADVDNDGSAEIVVTSNSGYYDSPSPAVQVVRDVDDRWVPARRIWNQHTYHVTNIREDGTVPRHETPHWTALNTFRTQAQVSAAGVCDPVPAG
jgi:hypothetical protein